MQLIQREPILPKSSLHDKFEINLDDILSKEELVSLDRLKRGLIRLEGVIQICQNLNLEST